MKYLTSIWTTIILASLLIGIRVSDPTPVEQLRLNTFDSYIRTIPETDFGNGVVLLNIGEEALAKYGQYPFPRHQYAQMLSDLREANAGMIGFTIMFPEADRFAGDEVFASWINSNGVILAQDADPDGRSKTAPYVGTVTFGSGDPLDWLIKYDGLVTNIPQLEKEAWGHGLINAMPEVDGLVRRIPLVSQINDELYPSFALETIRVMQERLSYTIKVNEVGVEEVIIRPFRIPSDANGSFWINPNYKFTEIEYGSELPNLGGQAVFIGLTAKGLASQIPTPAGLMPAHQIQAAAIQSIMDEVSISRPVWTDLLEILVMSIGALVIVLAVYHLPIVWSMIIFFATVASSVGASFYFWYESQILLDMTYSMILYIMTFASSSFSNFYKQFMLRQQIKKQFETYLDPKQVYLLQKNPELLRLGGDRKEMSFLFMDICGFTPISEHYKNNDDPEGLVELVNEFLDAMTKIILNNGGTIDKYMGDCIMAFWNAPLPCKNHAEMAVKSSIEIEAKTNELKEVYKSRGLPDINVGTGVNTGDCIVGNMGSESRFDYSVIGDAVNLAARLEATAARHEYVDYKTIISSFTKDQLPDTYKCDKIGDIKVKGKEETIEIYSPGYNL
jgi:adenylate cyclase